MHVLAERAERVQTLLAQGQDLFGQRRFEESIEALRQAHQLDPRSSLVRAALFSALTQRARCLLDTDWHSAEALIEQALEIDPAHALAKSLRALASNLVARDLERAQAEIEEVLSSHPSHPTVSEQGASLSKELVGSQDQQQTRLRDLGELKSLHQNSLALVRQWLKLDSLGSTEWDSEVAKVQALSARAETIAKQYPKDPEFQSLATGLTQRLATPPPKVESRSDIKQTSKVSGPGITPLPAEPQPKGTARPKDTLSPRRVPPLVVASLAADEARARKGMPQWALVVAGIVVIVGGMFAALWHITRPSKKLPATTLYVEFVTSPPDANILIDGSPSAPIVKLQEERTYRVEARKDGYLPASQSLNLKAGSVDTVWLKKELTLQPLPLVLRVSTDLDGSAVWLDDVDKGRIQAGRDLTLDVDAGSHTLTVASGKSEVTIAFEAGAATLPTLSARIKTTKKFKGTTVVVTAWGNQARVETNASSLKVAVDNKPAQEVGFGLDLDSLAPGSHDVVWGGGKVRRSFEAAQAPNLNLFIVTGRKVRVGEVPRNKAHAAGPKPTPLTAPAATTAHSNAEKVRRLYELAYNASLKGKYVEPQGENAIAYAKQVLAIDKNDTYAKNIIEHSVKAEVSQAQQALKDKNAAFAQQAANAMAQLLPGRSEIAELQKGIAVAERASPAALPRQSAPTLSFRVAHIHTKKVSIGNEPYCEGILSVTGQHLKFDGQAASQGQQLHHLDFPSCSSMEIKKNTRIVGIGQRGFHVRKGSQKDNFVPEKNVGTVVSALQKACKGS